LVVPARPLVGRVTTTGAAHVAAQRAARCWWPTTPASLPWDAAMMAHHAAPAAGLDRERALPGPRLGLRAAVGLGRDPPQRRPSRPRPTTRCGLLEQDHLVMVFPEGRQGASGKPFGERYRLQRFGRGGFVELAPCAAGAPIIPVRGRGQRGDLPQVWARSPAWPVLFGAPLCPDHAHVFPLLGPPRRDPPLAVALAHRVSAPPIDLAGLGPDAGRGSRPRSWRSPRDVRDRIQTMVYEKRHRASGGVPVTFDFWWSPEYHHDHKGRRVGGSSSPARCPPIRGRAPGGLVAGRARGRRDLHNRGPAA